MALNDILVQHAPGGICTHVPSLEGLDAHYYTTGANKRTRQDLNL